MLNQTRKQFSKTGAFCISEAILDLLHENYSQAAGMGAAAIGEKLGIYRKAGEAGLNDAIVTGFLNELCEQGKVLRKTQLQGRGGWTLSAEEYKARGGGI